MQATVVRKRFSDTDSEDSVTGLLVCDVCDTCFGGNWVCLTTRVPIEIATKNKRFSKFSEAKN